MNNFEIEKTNKQMRDHLPHPMLVWLRYMAAKMRGVRIDKRAILFSGVKLLRYPENIELGASCVIKSGAHICPCNKNARVSVGKRSTVGFHSFLYASSQITVGDDCMIAPFVYIVDSDHGIKLGMPMNSQPNKSDPICIGDDVWVGAHSVILAGITIGSGAIVAAGAVVRDDVPPNTIVGGVPATVIGLRK